MKESGQISMKVIGVGGAGANIVDRLMLSNPSGVQLTVINTDHQALANSPVIDKRCIGELTRGLEQAEIPKSEKRRHVIKLSSKRWLKELICFLSLA